MNVMGVFIAGHGGENQQASNYQQISNINRKMSLVLDLHLNQTVDLGVLVQKDIYNLSILYLTFI